MCSECECESVCDGSVLCSEFWFNGSYGISMTKTKTLSVFQILLSPLFQMSDFSFISPFVSPITCKQPFSAAMAAQVLLHHGGILHHLFSS